MLDRVQWVFRAASAPASGVDRSAWIDRIETACQMVSKDMAPRIKSTATVEAPPRWNVFSFSRQPLVLISIDTPNRAALRNEALDAGLDHLPETTWASFGVTTSVPVAVPHPPQAGQTTPGVELLTLFRRKKGLDDETFLHRWHGGHTPMSIEIHPLWGYIRNVVDDKWPDEASPLDGIVEEFFKTRRDLLNPAVFFNGGLRMVPNMLRVYFDVRSFIDLATIETYWVQERWLRVG